MKLLDATHTTVAGVGRAHINSEATQHLLAKTKLTGAPRVSGSSSSVFPALIIGNEYARVNDAGRLIARGRGQISLCSQFGPSGSPAWCLHHRAAASAC